jgi:ferric-dicitrate binding protein FerR (iron transport regulator)
VTVSTGTIEFFNSAYKVEVGKGEKASMVNKNQKIIKSINTDPNFDAWKTGELKFNNTELSSILLVLENYYGISFRASNSDILSCRFTGTFQNDRLESVLQVLSFGLNFKYRFDEGGYILTGEGCNKSN